MNNTLPCLLKRFPFEKTSANSQTAQSEPTNAEDLCKTLLEDIENPRIRELLASYKNGPVILDDVTNR